LLHYVGNAVLWQSSNRIQADRIDIDRDRKTLLADGQVISQFEDNKKGKPAVAQPIFTIVRAQRMAYSDADRQAVYTGGANLTRPNMTVKSATIRAFLNDDKSDADSRINHAFSDGAVEIVQSAGKRQRIGMAEHAEYYTEEGKVILSGGEPQLKDTLRGNTTRGETLTYFTDDDRLTVDGGKKPVRTDLRRKKR